MKRHAMATCLLMAALGVCAQTQEQDSLRVINLQEVEVISTRATNSTPVAFTNIGKEQLKKQNFGQDLPYLLSMTPSAITTSDAGAGVGYTTLRVRGTDGTRINVTANGIPINDAESRYSGSTCRISPPPSRICRCNAELVPQRTVQELSVPASTCRRVISP